PNSLVAASVYACCTAACAVLANRAIYGVLLPHQRGGDPGGGSGRSAILRIASPAWNSRACAAAARRRRACGKENPRAARRGRRRTDRFRHGGSLRYRLV